MTGRFTPGVPTALASWVTRWDAEAAWIMKMTHSLVKCPLDVSRREV